MKNTLSDIEMDEIKERLNETHYILQTDHQPTILLIEMLILDIEDLIKEREELLDEIKRLNLQLDDDSNY